MFSKHYLDISSNALELAHTNSLKPIMHNYFQLHFQESAMIGALMDTGLKSRLLFLFFFFFNF